MIHVEVNFPYFDPNPNLAHTTILCNDIEALRKKLFGQEENLYECK